MLFSRDQLTRAQQAHLGERVADYVDGVLTPDEEYRADLHLTVCEHCRYAVRQEREIIEQLRSVSFDSAGHQQLLAGLLSLGTGDPATPHGATAAAPTRPTPAVVTCSAPPQYQSARRSMACALVAVAGCVGVAMAATSVSGVTQERQTPPRAPGATPSLVRDASGVLPARSGTRRTDASLTQDVAMFVPQPRRVP